MTANERRAEIMRILTGRRSETMGRLALELGVTDRTIRNDIMILTADYPLDTVRGNGGCVKLADWYRPNKHLLSQKQQTVLLQLMDKADDPQREVLRELLTAFGSPTAREQLAKEALAYE